MKFKVNDKVRIIGDRFTHFQEVGAEFTIKYTIKESRTGDAPCNYQEYLLSCDRWACEEDLEAGGVDNWEWHYESLKEGGYFKEEDDE